MPKKPTSFAKSAPIRLRSLKGSRGNARAIDISDGFALKHLNIGVNWFDGKNGPEPWVWASALTLHLFLTAILITIPPMEFKDRQVFGVEIVTDPPKEIVPEEIVVEKAEPKIEVPPKPAKIAEQPKQISSTPEVSELEFQPKSISPIVPKIPNPTSVRIPQPEEVIKLEPVLPKLIEKKDLNPRKIAPIPRPMPIEEIKPNEIEEPIEEIRTPERVTLDPVQMPNLRNTQRIEPKAVSSAAPINLGGGNLKQNKNSIIPSISPNLNIDEEKLSREAEARAAQQAAQAARDAAAKQAAAKSANAPNNVSNTAPIAKNGELAQPSGAGVTAIAPINGAGGNGSPNAGSSQAAGGSNGGQSGVNGPLPRGPRIVGNGRNVFENNENGSLLARMARTADCSNINRERDEKCPNWEPLEKAGRPIPAPIPKNMTRPQTGVDPLPACPLGTPQSNIGRTCLPSKSAPNGPRQ